MSEIGRRIKVRRMELNMTQAELAKRLGYKNKTAITKIENGINDITQTKVIEFAKALDVPIAYLMGWDEQHENPALLDAAWGRILFDKIKKLSPAHRSTIEIMVDAFLAEELKEKEADSQSSKEA